MAEPTRGWVCHFVCGVDVILVVTLVNTSAVTSLVVLAQRAERQTIPAAGRTQLVARQAALYIHSTLSVPFLPHVNLDLLKQRKMEVVVTTAAISRAKLQSNHHHQ